MLEWPTPRWKVWGDVSTTYLKYTASSFLYPLKNLEHLQERLDKCLSWASQLEFAGYVKNHIQLYRYSLCDLKREFGSDSLTI
jgi:hypothetical protein